MKFIIQNQITPTISFEEARSRRFGVFERLNHQGTYYRYLVAIDGVRFVVGQHGEITRFSDSDRSGEGSRFIEITSGFTVEP